MSRIIYTQKKKRHKKVKQLPKAKRLSLTSFANELNKNIPKSEIWFRELFEKESLKGTWEYNVVINRYIVDVMNYDEKIVIEIDGSYHEIPKQIVKDFNRDQYFWNRGYKVFRIKAYDMISYEKVINSIKGFNN